MVAFRVCSASVCCQGHQDYYFFCEYRNETGKGTPPPYASGPRSPNQPAGYEYIDPAADIQKYFAPL